MTSMLVLTCLIPEGDLRLPLAGIASERHGYILFDC